VYKLIPFVLAVVMTSNVAWADDAEQQAMAQVRFSTEPSAAAGCLRVGSARDDSIKDLRKKIVRAGGDTGILSFGLSDIRAEVFRCHTALPSPPPAAVPPTLPLPPNIPPPPPGPPPPPPPGVQPPQR
jgi:hypothetical protein